MEISKTPFARAFSLIVLSSIFSRVFTIVKDILVAKYFGRGPEIEVFLLAYIIPYTISSIAGGAIGASFVPLHFYQPSIEVLVYSTLLGLIIEALVLIFFSVRNQLSVFRGDFANLKDLMRGAFILLGGNILTTSSELLDKVMAGTLAQGSVP